MTIIGIVSILWLVCALFIEVYTSYREHQEFERVTALSIRLESGNILASSYYPPISINVITTDQQIDRLITAPNFDMLELVLAAEKRGEEEFNAQQIQDSRVWT